MLLHLPDDIS